LSRPGREKAEHQVTATEPTGEAGIQHPGQKTGWKDRCSLDMQQRENKGNNHCKGPLGTNRKITGHKEIWVNGKNGGE
jgi:hypothetical protein